MATLAAKVTDSTPADLEARNEMILANYPMVERIAHRVAATLGTPTGMEVSDLTSHGVLGLVEAWNRFDPSRGVPFETYAIPRVRGAIVDAIREVDWIPRKVRARARRLDEATASLTNKLGRAPTGAELAEQVGSDAKPGARLPATVLALEASVSRDSAGDGAVAVADMLADPSEQQQPGWAIEDAETRSRLLETMNLLAERDRLILTLYYFQGVPLTEIARALNVTESRVSQLHMRALTRLRQALDTD